MQRDPARDVLVREAIPGADLVAVYTAEDADHTVHVCVDMRGKASPELVYTIRFKAVGNGEVIDRVARDRRGPSG